MIFQRNPVNYSLVGERDGCAGREPSPALWRKLAYRSGYAHGLLERAQRIARAELPATAALAHHLGAGHADLV